MKSIALLAIALFATAATADDFSGGKWIDLTHAYNAKTIYWPTEDGFQHVEGYAGYTDKGYYYYSYGFSSAEHGGTHVDAPIHFAEGRHTVDQMRVDQLIGPVVVIDVATEAQADRDYQVNVSDFESWEAQHGRLPDGCIVLLNTGSSKFWPDRVKYMGTDLRGQEGVAQLHFPGLHPEGARWLVSQRNIKAIGLDTPSIDYGQSTHFESHQILFEKNIPALENVANIDQLPATGATIIALPMKIEAGSGGPTRIVAWIPE